MPYRGAQRHQMTDAKGSELHDAPSGETRDDRRDNILTAVLRKVATEGTDRITLEMIAREAGVSKGLVVYHFSTKEELLSSAWLYALQMFRARIAEISGPVDGLDWMQAMYRVCFTDRDEATPPWNFWLEYWAKASRTPKLREHHSQQFARLRGAAADRAKAAIESGQLRDDVDPDLSADLFYTLIYGLAVQVTLDHETVSPDRAWEIANFALSLLRSKPDTNTIRH